MSAENKTSKSSPTPDYNAPTFRGALTVDYWHQDGAPEFSRISIDSISEVGRASNAIQTISRIVHNSLSEPNMSGAEPLGHSAHLALLDALQIIGAHLENVANSMQDGQHTSIEPEEPKNHPQE